MSAQQFINQRAATASPVQSFYEQLKNYHERRCGGAAHAASFSAVLTRRAVLRRLWHQLTEALTQLLAHEYFASGAHNSELT